MKYVKLVFLSLLVLLPATAFGLYKPLRILLPETFGVICDQNVCVDNSAQRETVIALFNAARETLRTRHGLIIGSPKIIFCSTEKCQSTFGLGKKAGFTFGAFGIVIAPRGWKEYYVAHELIHYWQAENFGSLVLLNGEPWLIEGMAYALSNDPRKKLHEPFDTYRHRFSEWRRLNEDIPLRKSVGDVL